MIIKSVSKDSILLLSVIYFKNKLPLKCLEKQNQDRKFKKLSEQVGSSSQSSNSEYFVNNSYYSKTVVYEL